MRRVAQLCLCGWLIAVCAPGLALASDDERLVAPEAAETDPNPAPAADPVFSVRMSEHAQLEQLRASERDFLLGLAAHEQGDLERAESAYGDALRKDPSFVEARVNLARVWIAQGRWAQAEAQLDQAIASHREYPPLHAARALLALERGETARARSELDRVLRLDPDDLEARINLSALLIEQRQLVEARVQLDRVLEMDPQNVAATLNRALLEDLDGRPIEAAYFYATYLALAPRSDPDRDAVEARLRALEVPSDATRAPMGTGTGRGRR